MSETTVGFLILAVGIVLVLSLVFAVTLRGGEGGARPRRGPPPGVHMPSPSMLPVVLSVGAALLGAGLIFKPDDAYQLPVLDLISRAMNPLVGLPGLAVLLFGVWSWVRDAGHEWRETEAGPPQDVAGH